ncbi:MAG: hypothetical protein WAL76_01415, partial [Candidatus Sulfotelmatobacter sp.]
DEKSDQRWHKAVGIRKAPQGDKEASQTRDLCVAPLLNKSIATYRAARPDPSLRKERLLRMTIQLNYERTNSNFGLRLE